MWTGLSWLKRGINRSHMNTIMNLWIVWKSYKFYDQLHSCPCIKKFASCSYIKG